MQAIVTPFEEAGAEGYLVILQDLTRIRRLETVRRDFISNISHELRTPLAELVGRLRATARDTDLVAYPIAKLAGARRTQDADLAAEAVTQLAAMIRRVRAKIWHTGGLLQWDWYEIAVDTWQSLSWGQTE